MKLNEITNFKMNDEEISQNHFILFYFIIIMIKKV